MKKILSVICIISVMTCILGVTVFAGSSPNYATSKERFQYLYDGYVQIQSSYNDNGQHAARGYIRYSGGANGDTGRLYTSFGTSMNDSKIRSRSYTYNDTLNPWAPKVKFNYGFDWVPAGSSVWPL